VPRPSPGSAQALHPVFALNDIRKVRAISNDLALARDNDGWRIRGNGELRTFRLPSLPRLADARGVAGHAAVPGGGRHR
jgi:hypothetical protein